MTQALEQDALDTSERVFRKDCPAAGRICPLQAPITSTTSVSEEVEVYWVTLTFLVVGEGGYEGSAAGPHITTRAPTSRNVSSHRPKGGLR